MGSWLRMNLDPSRYTPAEREQIEAWLRELNAVVDAELARMKPWTWLAPSRRWFSLEAPPGIVQSEDNPVPLYSYRTVRSCIDCGDKVFHGPTRCLSCVLGMKVAR